MKFFYITNNVKVAKVAQKSGVDRIFVDLEYIGKDERQKNLDTVKSKHTLEDVANIRANIESELLVRVNPIHNNSEYEINRAIDNGADYVMLPMFKTSKEVQTFVKCVNKNAKTILLFEHIDAINNIDEILSVDGINEVYIGLNDLHLSMNLTFMFELLTMDLIERVCEKFKEKGIPYGIGGVANLGEGLVPGEVVFTELFRLGANSTILSRSFMPKDKSDDYDIFKYRINLIRKLEESLQNKDEKYFFKNKKILENAVQKVVAIKKQTDRGF